MTSRTAQEGRSTLHRHFKTGHCSHVTCSRPKPQKLWNRRSRDELGLEAILFTLVGQTIALCGLFWGGLRPAKFHEKRLDIAACQNGKAGQSLSEDRSK